MFCTLAVDTVRIDVEDECIDVNGEYNVVDAVCIRCCRREICLCTLMALHVDAIQIEFDVLSMGTLILMLFTKTAETACIVF